MTLTDYINKSNNIVVFSGAGISTESGISDYRSQGGIWERYQPVTIQEFLADEEKRKLFWQRKRELFEQNKDAKPNAGHYFIVELEKQGKLRGLITQNIDGLHQQSGFPPEKMLEIHGTNQETVCLSCGDIQPWAHVYERLVNGEEQPHCRKCNEGWIKSNTISFGQNLNQEVLQQAFAWAWDCDLMLAIGSSLQVHPAASLVPEAKRHGAWVVIITQSETPFDDMADLVINGGIGETLETVDKRQ